MRRILLLVLLLIPLNSLAAKPKEGFESFIKEAETLNGWLTLFNHEEKWYLKLDANQLNEDFLITASIARGLGDAGFFSGTMLKSKVASFRRVDDEVHFLYRNVINQSKDDAQVEEAVKIAFQDSIIEVLPILATEGDAILIDASSLFAQDLYDLGAWVGSAFGARTSFNPKLSRIDEVKNFKGNTEIRSNLVFTARTSSGNTRSVETLVHYSFFPYPDEDFKARPADQRVGHFVTALRDYSIIDRPDFFVRYVNRFRLEKADEDAKMSLPKKPIVFYLSRTIPHKYRRWVREAVLEWNKAFEKIGFIGAVEARIQMDGEDFDPENNMYNTISWIATDTPRYGAIGPSRVNPLTGEILDADILVDESMIRGKAYQYDRMFGRPMEDEKEPDQDEFSPDQTAFRRLFGQSNAPFEQLPCRASEAVFHQLGLILLAGASSSESASTTEAQANYEKERERFIGQAVKWTVMHEVGHTLGLRHNFKASTMLTLDQMQDPEIVEKKGLYNSVMEYPGANLPAETGPTYYFTPTLGPYDYWAIEYAYKPLGKDPLKELDEIASRSLEPDLVYATDEDTYGADASDVDPYANIYDLGAEPMDYATRQIQLVHKSWDKIVDRLVRPGDSFQFAEGGFFGLLNEYLRSVRYVSKYVGGKVFSRMHRTTEGRRPIEVVDFEKQRQALKTLADYVFSDRYLDIPASLAESIPPSRWMHWGTDVWMKPMDKNIQGLIHYVQTEPFQRLLHPRVLARIVDQEHLYAGKNPLTLEEMLTTIMSSIFSEMYADARGSYPKTTPFVSANRRALQRYYVKELMTLVNEPSRAGRNIPWEAKTMARYTLKKILYRIDHFQKEGIYQKMDAPSRIHFDDIYNRIRHFMESQYVITNY